jgi:hypothetical protein
MKFFNHWVAPWPLSWFLQNVWWDIDFKICGIPISIDPPAGWWFKLNLPGQRVGTFKKKVEGVVYRPERWGGYVLGIEIGQR